MNTGYTVSAIDPKLVQIAKEYRGEPTKRDVVGAAVVGAGSYYLASKALPASPGSAAVALMVGLWWWSTSTTPQKKHTNPDGKHDPTTYFRDGL